MDFWRRSASKSRPKHVRNEDIRTLMKLEHTIIDDIEKHQLAWYGHVKIMPNERLPKNILELIPVERRKRGNMDAGNNKGNV